MPVPFVRDKKTPRYRRDGLVSSVPSSLCCRVSDEGGEGTVSSLTNANPFCEEAVHYHSMHSSRGGGALFARFILGILGNPISF